MSISKNLTIIGSSHIAKESIEEITTHIEKEKPELIALELDLLRLNGLIKKRKKKLKLKDIKKIGINGLIFNLFGAWTEKKMGKLVGVSPGAEMLSALKLAKEKKIKVYLIDRDIRLTLRRISKLLPLREKLRLLKDALTIFLWGNRLNKLNKLDLTKVPDEDTIGELKKEFNKRYPTLYKILITERNIIMSKNLNNLINNHPDTKILAIVGAGHKKDMLKILKNET